MEEHHRRKDDERLLNIENLLIELNRNYAERLEKIDRWAFGENGDNGVNSKVKALVMETENLSLWRKDINKIVGGIVIGVVVLIVGLTVK